MLRFAWAVAIGAGLISGLPPAASAQSIGIATSAAGSLFHGMGSAVAAAAKEAGLSATIQPAASSSQYIPFVNSGGIEFGIANLQEVVDALEGEGQFQGSPNPNLRIVATIVPLKEAIFVRADGGIDAIADLRGKRVTDGFTADPTILPQLEAIYATAGLSRADIVPVEVPSVAAGADAFIAGKVDGFLFALGADRLDEIDAAVGGLLALPIAEPSEAALVRAREHWPTAFFTEVAAGSSAGVRADASYFAYPQVVFTNAGVPDDVVHALARALHDGKDTMAATFPPFADFDPDGMSGDVAPAEYHPGALSYYAGIGLD